jgi:restriction endonuclease S subunit
MVDQFVAASKGVGDIQRQVFWPFLRMVQVPLPKTEEQRVIVQYLEAATAGLINSISRLEREIELLREYRTRFIADVVTGKLDVRKAALRLPDEAPPDTSGADADIGEEIEAADEEAVV